MQSATICSLCEHRCVLVCKKPWTLFTLPSMLSDTQSVQGRPLPVLHQSSHFLKLRAAGGGGLNAAPQGAVLPQSG